MRRQSAETKAKISKANLGKRRTPEQRERMRAAAMRRPKEVRQAMARHAQKEAARILLQVHDEIIWERGPEWHDHWVGWLKNVCENAYELEVPLVFEIGVADSWAAKGGSNTQAVAEAVAALA